MLLTSAMNEIIRAAVDPEALRRWEDKLTGFEAALPHVRMWKRTKVRVTAQIEDERRDIALLRSALLASR
jgi:hypothetical protein